MKQLMSCGLLLGTGTHKREKKGKKNIDNKFPKTVQKTLVASERTIEGSEYNPNLQL